MDKLQADINRFLEVYAVMSPASRAHFEAQLTSGLRQQSAESQKLYGALLQAAQEGKNPEEALAALHASVSPLQKIS